MVGGTKISLSFFQTLFHQSSDLPAMICILCHVPTAGPGTINGKDAAASRCPPVSAPTGC